MRGLEKGRNIESYLTPNRAQCRNIGANSARAIKKLPFKEEYSWRKLTLTVIILLAIFAVPRCECGGLIKPDVVLYEEGLDQNVIRGAVEAIASADTLIIGGTSLVVYPAAGFIDYFRGKHLVVINKSATGRAVRAELSVSAPIGEIMSGIEVR